MKNTAITCVLAAVVALGCGGKGAKDKPAPAADTAAVLSEAADSAQGAALEIIRKDYKNKKNGGEFNIHLENVGNSDKTYNIINKLIYNGKKFDEYIEYRERKFIKDYGNDDGMLSTDWGAVFELTEKYSIICGNDARIIFEYRFDEYTGGAHSIYGNNYVVIDLTEEKILNINELISPIPDDILDKIIKSNSKYNIDVYFRDSIWPPDAINFCNENITLLWNPYTIAPYSEGQIIIEVQDKIAGQYLTDKGKLLM